MSISRTTMKAMTPKLFKSYSQTEASQQALLDNFDLEIDHRTFDMRAQLDATLGAFIALVDSDLLKIPKGMRIMKIRDLENCWAGGFAETSRALAEQQFERLHPEKDHLTFQADAVAGKRKRGAQAAPEDTSERSNKNPRTQPTVHDNHQTKRRAVPKRGKPSLHLSPSTGTSTLPQNHQFNPLLKATPKHPRAPRRNESFFSHNGSPVEMGLREVVSLGSRTTNDENSGYDLPDPQAMERAAFAVSARTTVSPSSKSQRSKRAPSLLFRTTLALPTKSPSGFEDLPLAEIPLSDGRIINFNPLNLTPGRIDDELADGGLGESEKKLVKSKVQEEVVRALTQHMERWKAL